VAIPARQYIVPTVFAGAGVLALAAILSNRLPLSAEQAETVAAPVSSYDWLQINGDPQHSGNNTQETVLGASNVASLQFLFQATLPSAADGAPVYLSGVTTASGVRDLLFVTTTAGHIIALDAHTGGQIWSRQYAAGTCRINLGASACYTTSSPAIDPGRQYVYSYGLDGYVHKYQVGDGNEIVTGGWPEPTTLKGFNEKGSSALAFATAGSGATYLYMTNGGYPGDAGDYQGHVTAINLADGAQKVFNALCSDQTVHFVQTPGTPDCAHVQTALWARVGVVYDAVTDRIYAATGNGLYDANTGGLEWGDSVISLNPDGTGSGGKPLDSYTPSNFQDLQNADADLGSTAPAILRAPGYAGRLAVQGGKDGKLRLVNLSNLSGLGGPGHVGGEVQTLNVPQGNVVLSALAVWINPADSSTWVFVGTPFGISGLKLTVTSGVPALAGQWQKTFTGFSPLVADNILYFAGNNLIRALDPLTGNLLWSDATHVGGIHWQSPVVANGVLYISDQSAHLTAFALPLAATPTSTRTPTPTIPSNTPTPTGTPTPSCSPFTDVAADGLCPFVREIFDLGVTTGTTATTFSPAGDVTRLQMAAFLSRTVDAALLRGGRRAALDQYWPPQGGASPGVTTVGPQPNLVRSDGADLWVSNGGGGGTVSRVRGSDGKLLETWTGALSAYGVLAATGRVFVTGFANPGSLYRIDPSQPAGAVTTVASDLGNGPGAMAFDGARIWTANNGGSISLVTPGATLPWNVTTVATGFSLPNGILYDGANIWVADFTAGTLLKLDGGGAILQTVTVGSQPNLAVFDGANIWVPNRGSGTVSVVRASTGAILATLTGNGLVAPNAAAFDGQRVLIVSDTNESVSLWKAADLTPLGFFSTGAGTGPYTACSDGVNFWITLRLANRLARF
jgi:hypothetical protein